MGRDVQVSSGGVDNLGYHVVWCPKYRRPVLAGLPTLWSRSYFAAIVGASAAPAQRYIEIQCKRPWREGKTR